MHTPKLVKFRSFVIKILSGYKILISIKDHNSVTNLQKITDDTPNLDLVNFNAHTKHGQFYQFVLKILSRLF